MNDLIGVLKKRLCERWQDGVVVIVLCVFYIAVPVLVPFPDGMTLVNGDEPHYLITAHSLIFDRDIMLRNNYLQRDYESFYCTSSWDRCLDLQPHFAHYKDRTMPFRPYLGFPLLIAPAYWLGGLLGVWVFLAGFTSISMAKIYQTFSHLTSSGYALIATLVLGISYPLVIYATQSYPEIAAFWCLTFLTNYVILGKKSVWMWGGLLALLPHLHIKFVVLSLMFLLVYIINSRPKLVKIAILVLSVTISLIIMIVWLRFLSGEISLAVLRSLGGNFNSKVWKGILGLWFDQEGGVIYFFPFFVFFLIASIRFLWKRNRNLSVVSLIGVYFLFHMFVGSYSDWRAGFSPVPRYLIPVFPIVFLLAGLEVYEMKRDKRWWPIFAITSASLTVTLIILANREKMFNWNKGVFPLLRDSRFQFLSYYLPHFGSGSHFLPSLLHILLIIFGIVILYNMDIILKYVVKKFKKVVIRRNLVLALLPLFFLSNKIIPDSSIPWEPFEWKVQLGGQRVEYSSPVVADIRADYGGLEILVGGTDGFLHMYSALGERVWHRKLSDAGMQSSPSLGDIDADGDFEIVVGTSGDNCSYGGGVYALDHWGNILWSFSPLDVCEGGNGKADGVRSSITLANLDNDEFLEIVFGAWDHRIYVLNHEGKIMWSFNNLDTVWSSPAVADLDGDGQLEIAIGADISPPLHRGGRFHVFASDGSLVWSHFLPEVIWSSPAIGDLNKDGKLEIVVGTGFYWDHQGYTPPQYEVYAWTAKGETLSGWPVRVNEGCSSSPALGNLDTDEDLEIVIGCEDGKAYAWDYDGRPLSGWEGGIQVYSSGGTSPFIRSSPIIADIDGDSSNEILVAVNWEIVILNRDGTHYTQTPWSSTNPQFNARGSLASSPAVADIDLDGNLEMIIAGFCDTAINESGCDGYDTGWLYVWEMNKVSSLPWPMFQYDPAHTGLYPLPSELRTSTSSLSIMHDVEDQSALVRVSFSLENPGMEEIDWYARTLCPNMVLSPSEGVLFDESTINVDVAVGEYDVGMHEFEIEVRGYLGNEEAPGSPVTIPIRLYVGDISKVYLPLGMRH